VTAASARIGIAPQRNVWAIDHSPLVVDIFRTTYFSTYTWFWT